MQRRFSVFWMTEKEIKIPTLERFRLIGKESRKNAWNSASYCHVYGKQLKQKDKIKSSNNKQFFRANLNIGWKSRKVPKNSNFLWPRRSCSQNMWIQRLFNMDSMFSIVNNVTNNTNNSIELAPTMAPSDPGMIEKPFFKWFRVAAYSVVCLSGVFGNLMVILASRKPGMITVSNILIANLAVADFTVSLINIPTVVVYSHVVYWPFGGFLCKFISFLQGLTLSASAGTLVAIAVERYWQIVHYTRRKPKVSEAYQVVAVIWASSIFIPLPLAVFSKITMWKQREEEVPICVEEWPNQKTRQAYTTLLFLLMYCVPLLLICGLYVQIGRFLKNLPPIRRGVYKCFLSYFIFFLKLNKLRNQVCVCVFNDIKGLLYLWNTWYV